MELALNISKRTGTFISSGPVLKAAALAVAAALLVQVVSKGDGFNVSSIYSGVFGLLAIFIGFLATFFVFVATKSNRFLEAIRETITFRQMIGLLRFTIQWTLLTIVATFVLMIVEPRDFPVWSLAQGLVFLWCWNVILIGVNFARCVSMFFSLVDQD